MPLKIYLDKRQNKHGEAPIRVVWSFNGDRYQTTMGFSSNVYSEVFLNM